MSNVPHLRFPEFSGEWEKCKLGDIAPLQRGFDLPAHQLEVGTNPVVYSNGIMNYHSSYKCKAPGLVTGRSGTIGKFTFISNGYYWPHNTSLWVTDFNGNIPEFIYYLYQTIKIEQYATGSGVPTLNRNDVHRHKVCVPHTIEQSKIAELFMHLDERIATQNKIIEDLKKLKSAISKHLFARKDVLETTICLSNIATLKNGYAFQSGKYNALGKWKILTITNVSGERYINDEDCNCIINLPNDIQDHQVLKEGDILISLTGNVGRVSLCKNGDYLLNQRVGLLQLAKNVNREFLYQILSSQRFEISMIACGQGAAQMNISKGDVESYVLPYSSNGNNILWVAKILHSYDERIINELRRLTLLTMQKQYLLSQMFI